VKNELPVWLYIHDPGTLRAGFQPPKAKAAYSGTITAVNYTEHHPRFRGIPAAWRSTDYEIEELRRVFHIVPPAARRDAPTQIVFRVDEEQDPNTIWVSKVPQPRQERVVIDEWTSDLDPGFAKFFTRASVSKKRLVHRPFRELDRSLRLSRQEVAEMSAPELRDRFELQEGTRVDFEEIAEDERSTFIYRAKYRR
jgi:hypothetical protein